jgi:hypothetical protein
MTKKHTSLAMLLTMLGAACSDDSGEPAEHEHEDPEEHACEHATDMSNGTAVTASAAEASAPRINLSEEPYLVTFEQGTRGFLRVAGPVDALVFVGQADSVTSVALEGSTTDVLPAGAPVEHCSDLIPEHFDLELEETGDYAIGVTSATPPLWLMVTPAEGHSH